MPGTLVVPPAGDHLHHPFVGFLVGSKTVDSAGNQSSPERFAEINSGLLEIHAGLKRIRGSGSTSNRFARVIFEIDDGLQR